MEWCTGALESDLGEWVGEWFKQNLIRNHLNKFTFFKARNVVIVPHLSLPGAGKECVSFLDLGGHLTTLVTENTTITMKALKINQHSKFKKQQREKKDKQSKEKRITYKNTLLQRRPRCLRNYVTNTKLFDCQ